MREAPAQVLAGGIYLPPTVAHDADQTAAEVGELAIS